MRAGGSFAVADETAYLAISLGVHRSKKVSGGIKKKRHYFIQLAFFQAFVATTKPCKMLCIYLNSSTDD